MDSSGILMIFLWQAVEFHKLTRVIWKIFLWKTMSRSHLCMALLYVCCINFFNTTKNNVLFINVSASRRKPSSGLTTGTSPQYVKACPIRGSVGSSPRLDSSCRSSWSIWPPLWTCQLCLILDQSPWRSSSLSHDSHCKRHLWLQICCRYWLPEVSPDEGFWHEAKTLINSWLY